MSESRMPPTDRISGKETLAFFNNVIECWNLDEHTHEENLFFVFHVTHLVLEALGQMRRDTGKHYLTTRYNYGEGFSYDELPGPLKNYALTYYFGEVYQSNANNVAISSTYRVFEKEPDIPKWEELSAIPVYKDMLEAAQNDPEVMAMIIPAEFIIDPGVEIKFSSGSNFKWGLQYILYNDGAQVIPFGEYGETQTAFEAAISQNANPAELLKTILELVVIGVNNLDHLPHTVEAFYLDVLELRLNGAAGIDISNIPVTPNPGNSVKNLLIRDLLKLTEKED